MTGVWRLDNPSDVIEYIYEICDNDSQLLLSGHLMADLGDVQDMPVWLGVRFTKLLAVYILARVEDESHEVWARQYVFNELMPDKNAPSDDIEDGHNDLTRFTGMLTQAVEIHNSIKMSKKIGAPAAVELLCFWTLCEKPSTITGLPEQLVDNLSLSEAYEQKISCWVCRTAKIGRDAGEEKAYLLESAKTGKSRWVCFACYARTTPPLTLFQTLRVLAL